jgi:hypothetical protein
VQSAAFARREQHKVIGQAAWVERFDAANRNPTTERDRNPNSLFAELFTDALGLEPAQHPTT